MTTLWEVITFTVQTSAVGNASDRLYANGQMQVPVIVSIRAIIGDTGASYHLTQSELQSIKLIDYYSRKELTGTWFYSTTENVFSHTLPGSRAPVEPIADGTQSIYFWVSSTKMESTNIAAQISQPGKDQPTIITTTGGSFDSKVTLTAIQPVTYTTSNVTFTREDTAEGTWNKKQGSSTTKYNWDQDNYYLTSNVYPFLKVDRHEVDTSGYNNGAVRIGEMRDSFAYLEVGSSDVSIFFMFNMGKEATVAYADIKVNQKVNALCLTRLRFFKGAWYSDWEQNAWFTIYDLYGNSGSFWVKPEEKNTMSISSKNTRSSTEPTSIEPAAKL
ncbi:hypothetical protein BO78DRAFT_390102 [Aspergillus sclerotiicarbonarius CBS 121057]|uniref:Uncharacterized protein n=1 Tax=Aspergillus sclerotiicarbonarius (strain CBS 121057 / IBT 28362) TaxID=1448318 RepID=A0A319DXS1_ASPSB|nr:hypothetical protein BO78DRAFT_390102 [Aspergillus sclerotiicarbonarius CBS 121057]